MSHSFLGLKEANISAFPAAVRPNLYATEPIGLSSLKVLICGSQSPFFVSERLFNIIILLKFCSEEQVIFLLFNFAPFPSDASNNSAVTGLYKTPIIGIPFSTRAMLTTKCGTPSMNSLVPSSGSTTQTLSLLSLFFESTVSSDNQPYSGKDWTKISLILLSDA